MGYSPLLLMLPCGLGAGYSVMLPQASIVLAVVYSFNRVRVSDMVCIRIQIWYVFVMPGSSFISSMIGLFMAVHDQLVNLSFQVKSGSVADVLFCLVVTLGLCTWGMAILDLTTVPWDIPEAVNDSLTTIMP